MRFRLLGPVEILKDGGEPVPVPSPRVRALVAILLLEGRKRVKAQALTDLLWDDPPSSAAANLRNHVAALRRLLQRSGAGGGPQLTTLRGSAPGRSSYLLPVSPEDLDVTDFQRLAAHGGHELARGRADLAAALFGAALQTWRGGAGEDVSGSASLAARLEALNEQRIGVQEQFIAARIACGETGPVIRELRDVLTANPLRERSWEHLIRALYLNGDVSSALTAYRQAQATLRGELGIDPSPELRRLHLAILRREDPVRLRVNDR